ncbi:MAG TPA: preprotein translocase subunit SecG [Casimicrobiaceae bacterium]|jgi:preprotein translocase subunit SecG|nr:preprotein translocase subunit SecG [Casimicrobiaceae bacterium]
MIWETVLIGVHFLIAVALIGFILMQHGKGADMGAAFGSGASGSLFGAAGSANFLSRTTAILATVFFLSSLGLTYLATNHEAARDLMQQGVAPKTPAAAPKAGELPQQVAPAAPATPAPADPNSKAGEIPK